MKLSISHVTMVLLLTFTTSEANDQDNAVSGMRGALQKSSPKLTRATERVADYLSSLRATPNKGNALEGNLGKGEKKIEKKKLRKGKGRKMSKRQQERKKTRAHVPEKAEMETLAQEFLLSLRQALDQSAVLQDLKTNLLASPSVEEFRARFAAFQDGKAKVKGAWREAAEITKLAFSVLKEVDDEMLMNTFNTVVQASLSDHQDAERVANLTSVDLYGLPFIQGENVVGHLVALLEEFHQEADSTLMAYLAYEKQWAAIRDPTEGLYHLVALYNSIDVEPAGLDVLDKFMAARERAKASWRELEESIRAAEASLRAYRKAAKGSGVEFWKNQIGRDRGALQALKKRIQKAAGPLYMEYVEQDPAGLILNLLQEEDLYWHYMMERTRFLNAVLAVESLHGSVQAELGHLQALRKAIDEASVYSIHDTVKVFMLEKYRFLGRLALLNGRLQAARTRLKDYRLVTESGGMWGALEQVDELRYPKAREQIGALEEAAQRLLVLDTLAIPTIHRSFLSTRKQRGRMLASTTPVQLLEEARRFAEIGDTLIEASNAVTNAIYESRESPEYQELSKGKAERKLEEREEDLLHKLPGILETVVRVSKEELDAIPALRKDKSGLIRKDLLAIIEAANEEA
jgi:hypothetical protein